MLLLSHRCSLGNVPQSDSVTKMLDLAICWLLLAIDLE